MKTNLSILHGQVFVMYTLKKHIFSFRKYETPVDFEGIIDPARIMDVVLVLCCFSSDAL